MVRTEGFGLVTQCVTRQIPVVTKDTHLTLRLPAALTEALDRVAAARGTARSAVVREALASYLAGAPRTPVRLMPAEEFSRVWASLPHLTPEEASAYADDIRAARASYPPERDPWA